MSTRIEIAKMVQQVNQKAEKKKGSEHRPKPFSRNSTIILPVFSNCCIRLNKP